MPVTASVLYNFVHCPKRVALDEFGDQSLRDPLNPFVRLLWERGTLYEREVIAGLDRSYLDLSAYERPDRERLTSEAMRRGEPLIYSGFIASDDLVGAPDILRKEVGGYVPGEIKSGAGEEGGGDDTDDKPKLHYAVQLALYVDILERQELSAGRREFVWDIYGDEVAYDLAAPQGSRKPETLWDEYQSALADTRAIFDRTLMPLGASSSTCKLCRCIDRFSRMATSVLARYSADCITIIAGFRFSVHTGEPIEVANFLAVTLVDADLVERQPPHGRRLRLDNCGSFFQFRSPRGPCCLLRAVCALRAVGQFKLWELQHTGTPTGPTTHSFEPRGFRDKSNSRAASGSHAPTYIKTALIRESTARRCAGCRI